MKPYAPQGRKGTASGIGPAVLTEEGDGKAPWKGEGTPYHSIVSRYFLKCEMVLNFWRMRVRLRPLMMYLTASGCLA